MWSLCFSTFTVVPSLFLLVFSGHILPKSRHGIGGKLMILHLAALQSNDVYSSYRLDTWHQNEPGIGRTVATDDGLTVMSTATVQSSDIHDQAEKKNLKFRSCRRSRCGLLFII
jgi:hypothetical protein